MRETSHGGQRKIGDVSFPLILETEAPSPEATFSWIQEHRKHLKECMERHGAIFFKKTGLTTSEHFEKALEVAGFLNMPYVGGAAPRAVVRGKRILTANESPPDQSIPFHHEMAQVPNPPAYVLFFCEQAPRSGGATRIVHSNTVYERFRTISPEFCRRVEEEGVRYVRTMPAEDDPASPIGRSWKNTFQVTTMEDAEEQMKALGTTWEWRDNGDLKTTTRIVPAIRTDARNGSKVFFNSMVAAYTGWDDTRNKGTEAVICGSGAPVEGEALLQTGKAMDEESVAIPWEEGDMLWIDNGLVLHARQPFEGPRRILASISEGMNDE